MANDRLLSRIHKNAQAGIFTIPVVSDLTDNADLRRTLKLQQTEYKNIYYSAERLSDSRALLDLSVFAKTRTAAMIKLGTVTDKSVSHFAEMMILGSTRGVIDMKKSLSRYIHAPKTSRDLARALMETEERNIERLKQFL